ncbi:hypothetical protein [Flavobacterium hungaricum]|uniref:MoxR-vWA-beta-propeller ternary system domain-containing protein n=1 Tax=Flavobacterium hungaricum TaxID=2082725 RepID=A0ABR9TN43_9FLAO|nr:hypothetical protein [Flavobacterium hungaricum]MBE8726770.1 hypothetical protein [Flavobacterium hungaricum]
MYFLEISKKHIDFLGAIRDWENVKMAFDGEFVWAKDFYPEQLNAIEIQQIPFHSIYELKENLLFKKGSLLPVKKLPSGLLWSPIIRAIPVTLPKFNHNYFGIDQRLELHLKPSEIENEAYALLTDYNELKTYIETAPDFRLKPLKWIVVKKNILLLGKPMLPIKGDTFWLKNNFLLPAGYDFEHSVLSKTIEQNLNLLGEHLIVWNTDNSCFKIKKDSLKPLSISSFRLTFS